MKKNVIKILGIIIIIIFVVGNQKIVLASNNMIIPSIMSENITDGANPEKSTSNVSRTISRPFTDLTLDVVKNILGAIQVIGGLLTIVSVAAYGLLMLLNTQPELMKDLGVGFAQNGPFGGYNPDTRKKLMEYIRQLIIGAALLFSSSSIVVFVMGILLN